MFPRWAVCWVIPSSACLLRTAAALNSQVPLMPNPQQPSPHVQLSRHIVSLCTHTQRDPVYFTVPAP